MVWDNNGHHEIELKPPAGWAMNRRAELQELYDAVVNGHPVYHSGEWGMATLEATLAIVESSNTGKLIELKHQVAPVPDYGDAKIFDLPPAQAGTTLETPTY